MSVESRENVSLAVLLAAPPRVPGPLGKTALMMYGAGNKGRDVLRLLREAGHDRWRARPFPDRCGGR